MIQTVFATKLGMSQAWTVTGKRVAITRCRVDNNVVVTEQTAYQSPQPNTQMLEIGFGTRKSKNMSKPLRSKLEKSGFSMGVRALKGVKVVQDESSPVKAGDQIRVEQVLTVGDVVKVQGTTKGRGFAGAVKRHGFHGGPKTHGQSDRHRAVGSIGAGTSPGRVWLGKRMPGHYGVDSKTVANLVVLHVDPATQEVWLSGPVPGHISSFVQINKTGKTKQVELDKQASGIVETPEVEAASETSASEDQVVAEEQPTQEQSTQAAPQATEEQNNEETAA